MAILQENQTARLGVRFLLDGSPYSISDAITKQIVLKKPSGTALAEDAEFLTDGSDGIIIYDAAYGYLDEDGTWEIQGFLETPSWKGHTRRGGFNVEKNIN